MDFQIYLIKHMSDKRSIEAVHEQSWSNFFVLAYSPEQFLVLFCLLSYEQRHFKSFLQKFINVFIILFLIL